MKFVMIAVLAVAATAGSAEAKGGKTSPIPAAYDYARERVPGYKKDYCEDSVGNHVMCPRPAAARDGQFSAIYR